MTGRGGTKPGDHVKKQTREFADAVDKMAKGIEKAVDRAEHQAGQIKGKVKEGESQGKKAAGNAIDKAANDAKRHFGRAADDARNRAKQHLGGTRRAQAPGGSTGMQVATGAAVGGLAGYLDAHYVEPFGYVFAGALTLLQALDHEGVITMPYTSTRGASRHAGHHVRCRGVSTAAVRAVGEEVADFVWNNGPLALGYAGGYLLSQAVQHSR